MNIGNLLLKCVKGDVPHHYKITKDALKSFDTGDLILFSGTGLASFIIKEFLHTEWSHCGIIFKPDRFSPHLPEHTCSFDKDYFFTIDKYGNMYYQLEQDNDTKNKTFYAQGINSSRKYIRKKKKNQNKNIGTGLSSTIKNQNEHEIEVKFAKHIVFIESEFSSKYNKDEDYQFNKVEKSKYQIIHDTQKRLHHNIKKNFTEQKRKPCPWKNNKCCFRCIIEMYDGIPLILESIRVNCDGLLDILTGVKGNAGVRLVSLLDRINSSHEVEIAARKLTNPTMFERDIYRSAIPLPEVRCEFQKLFQQYVFPKVVHKQYESDKIELLSSFCRPSDDDEECYSIQDEKSHKIPNRHREDHTKSFFCSELVAFALIDLGLLNHRLPCTKYTPQDLSSELPDHNILNNGYEFSQELFFAHFDQD